MNSARTINRAHLFRLHSTGKITFSIFRKIFVQNEPNNDWTNVQIFEQ